MRQIINLTNYIVFMLIIGGSLAIAGHAANFVVNSNLDNENDGCGISPSICTLREAVTAANAVNDADTITIDAGVTTITLLTGEIALNTGAVTITPSALNALVTINGAANGRLFNVSADTTLNRLLLTNAVSPSSADGGAIINNGAVLTVNDSYITNNTATGNGGGIYTNGGTVNVNRSTIGGATVATRNVAANGGGIYNQNGTVNLTNSTLSGNTAGNIGGGYYGFASIGAATLNSTSSTVAFNSATNGGGISVSSTTGLTSTASINNTIISNNAATNGPDVNGNPPVIGLPGTITSGGYNLIRNTTGATIVAMTGDQFGANGKFIDPLLQPLTNNGGLTPTHALQFSPVVSPAIDKGNTAQTVDQRSLTRDDDFATIPNANNGAANGTDIGAFEFQIVSTASEVVVGGRVTTGSGKSVSRVVVTLTNGSGTARTARTNSSGYYRFKDVPSGATYIFEARSKQHTFNPKIITITEESGAVDFVANP